MRFRLSITENQPELETNQDFEKSHSRNDSYASQHSKSSTGYVSLSHSRQSSIGNENPTHTRYDHTFTCQPYGCLDMCCTFGISRDYWALFSTGLIPPLDLKNGFIIELPMLLITVSQERRQIEHKTNTDFHLNWSKYLGIDCLMFTGTQ